MYSFLWITVLDYVDILILRGLELTVTAVKLYWQLQWFGWGLPFFLIIYIYRKFDFQTIMGVPLHADYLITINMRFENGCELCADSLSDCWAPFTNMV